MDSTATKNQAHHINQPSTDSIPDVEFLEAFERTREALDAIPAEKLAPVRVNPSEAMARGIRVAENAQRDRVAFEAMYVNPPLEAIDWLRARAMAVKGAELSAKKHEAEGAVRAPDFTAARAERDGHKSQSGDGRDYAQRAMVLLEEDYSQVRDYAFPLYRENPEKWREDYPPLYARSVSTRSSRPTTDEKDEKDEERREMTDTTPTTSEPTVTEG